MRTTCPRCDNSVLVHLTPRGVTMVTHRVSSTSSEVCRPEADERHDERTEQPVSGKGPRKCSYGQA